MAFEISFIFKLNNDINRQFGKIILRNITPNHKGLDREIKKYVNLCINQTLNDGINKNININIGILGISNEFCSDHEFNSEIFDLYIDCSNYDIKHHYFNYNGVKEFLIYK